MFDIKRIITASFGHFVLVSTLRAIAMLGRFAFVIYAAKHMDANEFGRFGMLTAMTLIVGGVAGAEAYQVLLRQIRQADDEEDADAVRRAYFLFVVGASAVAGVFGLLALAALGWSGWTLIYGILLVIGEYTGLEIYRNLINEHRPVLGILNNALRSGFWCILVPILALLTVNFQIWSLNLVLFSWVIGDVVALVTAWPLFKNFIPRAGEWGLSPYRALATSVASRCAGWIIVILAWRTMENGGRLFIGILGSEALAGRLTLLSTIASLCFVIQKSFVEPMYFAKILGGDADRHFGEFSLMTILSVVGGLVVSVLGLLLYVGRGHTTSLTFNEYTSFGCLFVAYAFLSISQIPHFVLYRQHNDHAIRWATIAGAIVMAVSAALLTPKYKLLGISVSMMIATMTMMIWKLKVAYGRSLAPQRPAIFIPEE